MNREKKMIDAWIDEINIDDLDGYMDAAIALLQKRKDELTAKGFANPFMVSRGGDFDIYINRLETDEEFNERVEEEDLEEQEKNKWKLQDEQTERKLLAELKAKYEKE
jgi:hypothetical protein